MEKKHQSSGVGASFNLINSIIGAGMIGEWTGGAGCIGTHVRKVSAQSLSVNL